MDNPVNCSFIHCKAYNCGRGATLEEHVGASGFGIGFGLSNNESMTIIGCEAYNCFNHGIFFEHQGRFQEEFQSTDSCSFHVSNCVAGGNKHNYAAIMGIKVHFDNCYSFNAGQFGFFLYNSQKCKVTNCDSHLEGNASFVIKSDTDRERSHKNQYNVIKGCNSLDAPYGLKVVNTDETGTYDMTGNIIRECSFFSPKTLSVMTMGQMKDLTLMGNHVMNDPGTSFAATIDTFTDKNNSWNEG